MFYAHFVLAKKGPLARIWLAAHWDKKLTKAHVFETNIESSVEGILQPKVKMALRTSGHLLLGIVRIYSRKAKYLLADCNEAFIKIKMAFRPGVVDLPEGNREAAVATITLPEVFHDFDAEMPDITIDMDAQVTLNQSRAEDITLKEDYGTLSLMVDDGFDDMGFDDPETGRDATSMDDGFDHATLLLCEDPSKEGLGECTSITLTSIVNKPSLSLDAPLKDDGFGGTVGEGLLDGETGGLFEPAGLFDEAPVGNIALENSTSDLKNNENQIKEQIEEKDENSIDVYDMGPASIGAPSPQSSTGSPAENLNDNLNVPRSEFDLIPDSNANSLDMNSGPMPLTRSGGAEDLLSDLPPDVANTKPVVINEEEVFSLVPLEGSSEIGVEKVFKPKRKRKLIVDEIKNISGEEMKAQLSNTADIVATLDLAPPTKRLMHWKETGGVEKLFCLPGYNILSRALSEVYQRHLTSQSVDNEKFGVEEDNIDLDGDLELGRDDESNPCKRRHIEVMLPQELSHLDPMHLDASQKAFHSDNFHVTYPNETSRPSFSSDPPGTPFSSEQHRTSFSNESLGGTFCNELSRRPYANELPQTSFISEPPQTPFANELPRTAFTNEQPRTPFAIEPPRTPFTNEPPRTPFANEPPRTPFGNEPPRTPFGNEPPRTPFANEPPHTPFTNEPPHTPYANDPPHTPFANDPPCTPYANDPPHTPFANDPPHTPFANDPPHTPFANDPPHTPFANDQPRTPFQKETPRAAFTNEQTRTPFLNESSRQQFLNDNSQTIFASEALGSFSNETSESPFPNENIRSAYSNNHGISHLSLEVPSYLQPQHHLFHAMSSHQINNQAQQQIMSSVLTHPPPAHMIQHMLHSDITLAHLPQMIHPMMDQGPSLHSITPSIHAVSSPIVSEAYNQAVHHSTLDPVPQHLLSDHIEQMQQPCIDKQMASLNENIQPKLPNQLGHTVLSQIPCSESDLRRSCSDGEILQQVDNRVLQNTIDEGPTQPSLESLYSKPLTVSESNPQATVEFTSTTAVQATQNVLLNSSGPYNPNQEPLQSTSNGVVSASNKNDLMQNKTNDFSVSDDDDFGAPSSVGPALPEEQMADETYEQYEERILTKRTVQMLHVISNKLDTNENVSFGDLVKDHKRKQVAQKFYTFLVLKKQQAVELQQDSTYGDLVISKGPKFNAVYNNN